MPFIPSKYISGMPDGFLPTEYMVLHPDGRWVRLNTFNSDVAIKEARKYARQWVERSDVARVDLWEGMHTLYAVEDIHVDVFGDSCIELRALWEMSTYEIWHAITCDTWPHMAPQDIPKYEPEDDE